MDGHRYTVFLSYFTRGGGLEPGYYAIIGLSMDGRGFIVFLSYFARGLEPGYYAIIGLSMDGRGFIVFPSYSRGQNKVYVPFSYYGRSTVRTVFQKRCEIFTTEA